MRTILMLGLFLLLSVPAQAQVTPDIDLKPAASNVALPKSLSGIGLKLDNAKAISLNLYPVLDMVAALERRGAKIQAKKFETSELTVLQLVIDGKEIAPIVVECQGCIIVFEY
jgi:hypothetical protein